VKTHTIHSTLPSEDTHLVFSAQDYRKVSHIVLNS